MEKSPSPARPVEQFLDILPAFRMPRFWFTAGNIAVDQFVHQQHGRAALDGRIEIELTANDPAVPDFQRRQLLEPLQQLLRVGAPMRLDISNDHVHAGGTGGACRLEHRIGLSDAGRCAKKDLEPTPARGRFLRLERRQQLIGIAASLHSFILANPAPD